jgi:hypothetical protein
MRRQHGSVPEKAKSPKKGLPQVITSRPVTVFSDLTEARNCVRARIAEPEGVQEEGRVFDSRYV